MPVFTLEEIQKLGQQRVLIAPEAYSIKPSLPDTVRVTARSRVFKIQWSRVDGMDGYRVAISSDQDMSSPDLLLEVPGADTLERDYFVGNIAATFYFAVQSYKGTESSDFSSVVSATTVLDSGIVLLVSSFTDTSVTGTTSETDLKTYTLPANTLASNDAIRITAWGTVNDATDNKSLRFYWGSTATAVVTVADLTDWRWQIIVANRNATNSQTLRGLFARNSTATVNVLPAGTDTEDTTAAVTIKFTGQLVNSADTITQNGWFIEHLSGTGGESSPPLPPSSSPSPSTSSTPSFSPEREPTVRGTA